MPGTWSISTTVRNPERIVGFLKALSRLEGRQFNVEAQALFFKELIKTKEYTPTGISGYYKKKYEDPEDFTDEEVKDILSQVHYKNKSFADDQELIYAFRGRTAVSNITKMGLAIAKESMGVVKITELGKKLLNDEVDLVSVFFRYFLKWQLPNPIDRGYKELDIIPFIAVMHVINKVNKEWNSLGEKAVGVSKEEFSLFLTTLIDYRDISETVKNIIDFRMEKRSLDKNEAHSYVERRFVEKAIEIFNLDRSDKKKIEVKVNTLSDYGDSAIRYFRQTKLLYYRGNGRYVDLAPTRIVEIESLLENFNGSSIYFSDSDSYLSYMSDINQPALPWENLDDLKAVYENLLKQADSLQTELNKQYKGHVLHQFLLTKKSLNTINDYNREIAQLREIIKTLKNDMTILRERSLHNIDLYINKLTELANRKKSISGQDPLNLEYYITMSLMALDDAKEIAPNYSVGDDNIPLFTAAGNNPDIECFYSSFNMICEVTLLRGRDQWINEGQPVMRHLRDFEERKNINTMENYCLFIAPSIHRDTLNTFWMSVKMGYEGKTQKIVPLTINQYVDVLKKVKELNNRGKRVTHKDFQTLLSEIFNRHVAAGSDSTAWLTSVDNIIDQWGA
ncbi:AlwI restriction endonuclease [Jeotgalicoccus saudimassiliensis]|uniref:AlwI restriction endonuclease n=1 Tax=Jeotgalicoccus saudimassiliensis TaxID=1461582 RepID=A0A078M9Q5_9STAP|nr:AlwI family type II restriction endonuclease [Jeotgalicoccus saudimassiliensis]CEA02969.1 AlwI restriction endonuclease [Jeotgalicoccus saudimassiliensis]